MLSGTYLDHQFDIIGHMVANVQLSILAGSLWNSQQFKNFVLIHTNTSSNFCQPSIGLISCFIDNINIEKLLLVLEQISTKLPEFFWCYF